MAVRDDRGDVKQTTTGFRGPLMVQSLTSAKSKFLSLDLIRFAESGQGGEVVRLLKCLIPDYTPSENVTLAS